VSTAVGVAGLAVGAIGAITGNEDLMFAGKIMGYVGLAGGLAGGVIGGLGATMGNTGATFMQGFGDAFAGASQHLSNAWDKGVGSWFSGGNKVTGAIGSSADDVAGAADDALKSVPTGATSSPNGQMGAFPEVTTPGKSITLPGDGVTVTPQASMAPAPSAGMVAPPSAPMTPSTAFPTVGVPGAAPSATANPGLIQSMKDGFSGMPDWMKYSLMTTGAQGVTGMAGGYFQGQQAEEALEHQKIIAQRDEQQRQLLNKNISSVPTLRFQTV
jgi:hypothetical protein